MHATALPPLRTNPENAAAIARGEHQIHVVDGTMIEEPSQRLDLIESTDPFAPNQTHVLHKHVGTTFEDDVARLRREPRIPGAGSFIDVAHAQTAVDRTIAEARNQRAIDAFVRRTTPRLVLTPDDLGEIVGHTVTRASLDSGHPVEEDDREAEVVLTKDPTFPEGYRVLTAYPVDGPVDGENAA